MRGYERNARSSFHDILHIPRALAAHSMDNLDTERRHTGCHRLRQGPITRGVGKDSRCLGAVALDEAARHTGGHGSAA